MTAHRVPEGLRETPLEKYLRRAWPLVPGRVWREALTKRDVRINGVKCGDGAAVRGGDELTLYIDAKWLEPLPEVLWTDGRLIACVKPQGLPVDVDQDGVGADTLLTRLERQYPGVRLCHRLDAQTGGIVLAAADETVWRQAFDAFREHGVKKQYHALALNRFDRCEGTLKAYLVKDARRAEVRVIHRDAPGARPITTVYRAGEAAAPGLYHVRLEPVTGRTHQLRAHMADFGHPLLGDDRYGDRDANRRLGAAKLCLWHERLTILEDSPLIDYRGMTFEAPAPEWIQEKRDRERS